MWVCTGLGRPSVDVFRSHTIRHTAGRTPLKEGSARHRGHYLHSTQQAQKI